MGRTLARKTPVTFAAAAPGKTVEDHHGHNKSQTHWMIIDDAFNADRLIEFLEALIKDAGKKIFLILDNLRVHHSKLVKVWVAERQDKIEPFFLLSHSPELNPELNQEARLNADIKHAIGSKVIGSPRPNSKPLPLLTGPNWSNRPNASNSSSKTRGSNMPPENSDFSWPNQQISLSKQIIY